MKGSGQGLRQELREQAAPTLSPGSQEASLVP